MADTGAGKAPGERSAAHALARSTGTSVGDASEAVATARRLDTLPQVAAAAPCAVEGCTAATWLENDHEVDRATSRLTVVDLLDRLCSHHHDLKSLDGWALAEGRGKRPFVPPDDPRHPRPANAPPVVAA